MPHFQKGSPEAKAWGAKMRARRGKNPLDEREAAEVRALKTTNLKLADEAQADGNYESASWRYGAAGALDVVNNRYSRDRNPRPSDVASYPIIQTSAGDNFRVIHDPRSRRYGYQIRMASGGRAKQWTSGGAEAAFEAAKGHAEYLDTGGARTANPITRGDLRSVASRVRVQNPPMLLLGNPGKSSYRKMNAGKLLADLVEGDLFRWSDPFPDEDPRETYVVVEAGRERATISAKSGWGMRIPPQHRVAANVGVVFLGRVNPGASSMRKINPGATFYSPKPGKWRTTDGRFLIEKAGARYIAIDVAAARPTEVYSGKSLAAAKSAVRLENPLDNLESSRLQEQIHIQHGEAVSAEKSGDWPRVIYHEGVRQGVADVLQEQGPHESWRGFGRGISITARRNAANAIDRVARRVNPSLSSAVKMTRRGNPAARMLPPRIANDPGFKRERAAYIRRHGCEPARVSVVNSPAGSPKFASAWGKAPEIKYDPASDASNKGPRVHHFGEKGGTKPYLVSSVEKGPRYLGLLGGTYRAGGEWILR